MTLSKKFKVADPMGLHLRAAVQLVLLAQKFKSKIFIRKNLELINARSILCLLQLAAGFGAELNFILDGDDASQALEAIQRFFENRVI